MLRVSGISLPLSYDAEILRQRAARLLHIPPQEIDTVTLVRRAADARRDVHFIATAEIVLRSAGREAQVLRRLPASVRAEQTAPFVMPEYPQCRLPHPPVIIGAGPAGLFAAWVLAQAGLSPILLERGKAVPERQKAVEAYYRTGQLDPECNVQFGEGGAGTFSDGKLNTGTKSPHIRQILQTFADCGAPEEILWQAKPHIGTDRLAQCIPVLRARIGRRGGTVIFGAKCTALRITDGKVSGVTYEKDGCTQTLRTDHVILAVGHSARDTFAYLAAAGIPMEQKPFSLGLRIEHRQAYIDRLCWGRAAGHPALGAASYQLAAHLPDGRGVYTFCMCPGGVVQAAASEPGSLVTNGMSCFAREGENANSAVLVGITPADFGSDEVLAGMALQRRIERAAYRAGGGKAPAILLGDFLRRQRSAGFGDVQPSYPLGTVFADPACCLPGFICDALRAGLPLLDGRLRGFVQPDAVLTAPETRSSSPVRILREPESLESPAVGGLYPCGEGAGYAGGIMSAAADGIRCAEKILRNTEGKHV